MMMAPAREASIRNQSGSEDGAAAPGALGFAALTMNQDLGLGRPDRIHSGCLVTEGGPRGQFGPFLRKTAVRVVTIVDAVSRLGRAEVVNGTIAETRTSSIVTAANIDVLPTAGPETSVVISDLAACLGCRCQNV